MRILHITAQRPDSTGSGIYIQAMLRESRARGHENFLISGVPMGEDPIIPGIDDKHLLYVEFSGGDISYTIPGMSDVMPYDSSLYSSLSPEQLQEYFDGFTVKLQQAVRSFQPQVIHSHHLWLLSSLTRQLFPDVPVMTSCHGSDLRQFKRCSHLRDFVLKGCQKMDAVLALTKLQKKEINQMYDIDRSKIEVVGAGYNDQLFKSIDRAENFVPRLLYAGKLSRAKGVPWLLRSLKRYTKQNWHLDMVGTGAGEEARECLSMASELGSQVTCHGAVPQEQLAALMQQSDIFILPSFYEGLPLVILEAMACRCRVVVTELPGVVEITQGKDLNVLSLVALPRLKNQDEPFMEDSRVFEDNLLMAINAQIQRLDREKMDDWSEGDHFIESFKWMEVFKKVENVAYQIRGV